MTRKAKLKLAEIGKAAEAARREIPLHCRKTDNVLAWLAAVVGEPPLPCESFTSGYVVPFLNKTLSPLGLASSSCSVEIMSRLSALAFEDSPFPEAVYSEAVAAAELLNSEQPVTFDSERRFELAVLGKALLIRQGCSEYRKAILDEIARGECRLFWQAYWDKFPHLSAASYIADTHRLALLVGPDEYFCRLAQEYFRCAALKHSSHLALFLLPLHKSDVTPEDRRLTVLADLYDRREISKSAWRAATDDEKHDPLELGKQIVKPLPEAFSADESEDYGQNDRSMYMAADQVTDDQEALGDFYRRLEGVADSDELVFIEAKLDNRPWIQAAAEKGWDQKKANTVERRWNRKRSQIKLPPLHLRIKIGHVDVPPGCLERLDSGLLIWRAPRT